MYDLDNCALNRDLGDGVHMCEWRAIRGAQQKNILRCGHASVDTWRIACAGHGAVALARTLAGESACSI